MNISHENIKKAKNIVGEWGYEEQYWWSPIAEALQEAQNKTQKAISNAIKGQPTNDDIKLLKSLNNMKYPKSELFEKLAEIEHERWSEWQKYMHSKCEEVIAYEEKIETLESVTIPVELYLQWERQIKTTYKELSEKEKDSDRDQVLKYWDLI